MQLIKKENVFNTRKVEQMLKTENQFIINLFSILSLPSRSDENLGEDETTVNNGVHVVKHKSKETTRAKSFMELQERLQAITGKKKLSYKDKLIKKSLKNRMKKKNKQDERNAKQKLLRAEKAASSEIKHENGIVHKTIKTAKPLFNSEGKMVFSKFDFSSLGSEKEKKQEKDPKKVLKNLENQKEKINELTEAGEIEKAIEIKEKAAWKNALAKAEGKKVKDDPVLLKKTVQKKEQKKRSSKKKWEARQEHVEKAKEDRQKKRSDNIEKRKKDKKKNKLKKAVKKGKIIPGF